MAEDRTTETGTPERELTAEDGDFAFKEEREVKGRGGRGDLREHVGERTGAPIVFVGGTGRSGTHVIARLLAQNRNFELIPVECRFHADEDGFPGLLAGDVTKSQFMRRMRGFWWKGWQTNRFRGLFRHIPRERLDVALAAFDRRFDADPPGACRQLFLQLLYQEAEQAGVRGIVEQSTDTVAQAPTLVRLFPEAKFIHVCRDGRDASASRVSQTRGLTYPRTRKQGLQWWEERIRAIDRGARAIPEGHLLEVSLDEMLEEGPLRAVEPIAHFAGVGGGKRMQRFFRQQMDQDAANVGRWRESLSKRQADQLDRLYQEALERLEADDVTCAPLLRRTWERRAGLGFVRPNEPPGLPDTDEVPPIPGPGEGASARD
jgi:Sulfotransferase family